MEPVPLPVAVRCWSESIDGKSPRDAPRRDRAAIDPRVVLVFDTETTVDERQQLTFGAWQAFARPDFPNELDGPVVWRDYQLIAQGLFHADNLRQRNPSGLAILEQYIHDHTEFPILKLTSRSEWIEEVFYPLAFVGRALVVGFNLPFDVSRLAVGLTASRRWPGGFSFILSTYGKDGSTREHPYRQRIGIKALDSKRAFVEFTSAKDVAAVDLMPEEGEAEPTGRRIFRGRFLDLRTLVFALTDQSHTLRSACQVFSVEHGKLEFEEHGVITPEYIDYNRRDVLATWELYCQLREEYERHPIDLPPTRAYSPASIGKAYLDAMRIKPVLARQPRFSTDVLGSAMVAYYGGRAECRVRRAPVPVVYLDFLSMYPTVNTLLGNWELLTSARIQVKRATSTVRAFLERVTLDDLFDPATWKELSCLVLVEPDGDLLPVRARYGLGDEWQIGLNPLTSDRPMWYTLADVVAAKLLTGKPAKVVKAIRLVPSARQKGLKSVSLRNALTVKPTTQDFFQRVVELRRGAAIESLPDAERGRLGSFLKVLANSASYGIFAEMNRQEISPGPVAVDRFGLDRQRIYVTTAEEAGRWCFPPLAASIAGAARLMLAMLERCVADNGGGYAFCDTDSMAVVATEHGELVGCPGGSARIGDRPAIRALSWREVDEIVERFAALNPYHRDAVPGSILEVEDENFKGSERRQLYAYAISAKRYCLYNLDTSREPVLRRCSESGLGHLMDPVKLYDESVIRDPEEAALPQAAARPWIRSFWDRILRQVYGFPAEAPAWFRRAALSRFSVSTPTLLDDFSNVNQSRDYADRIKPFNFLLVAHDASIGPGRKVLIAPFERNSARWSRLRWTNRRDGREYRIATREAAGGTGAVRVTTYRDVFARHLVHMEAKSAGPDGRPCRRDTAGPLQRLPVAATGIQHIGGETHRLEEVQTGLVGGAEEVYVVYEDQWELARQALAAMPIVDAMRVTDLGRSAVMELRAGRSRSSRRRRAETVKNVAAWALGELSADNFDLVALSDVDVIAAWLGSRHEAEWTQGSLRE